MKKINYLGKEYETTYDYELLGDDDFIWLRNEYYKKPDKETVFKELRNIYNGGVKNTDITNYYVRDLMDKTINYRAKWCIEDVLNSKELLSLFWYRTTLNKKVYPDTDKPRRKLDTIFRIGAMGLVSRPSNFPIKKVDEILEKYNINNYWYDFSCGWGSRLLGSLRNRCNYLGTDPNYLLVDKLKEMTKDYKEANDLHRGLIDIRCQGSENFVPEWENKVGLAFSSPPYFYLEDYQVGKQSWKEGVSYNEWLENYLRPTIKNIYKYLIQDGNFLINIKNFKEFLLLEDTKRISQEEGFELIEEIPLELCKKGNPTAKGGFVDIDEKILVFKKGENKCTN